MPMSIVFHKHTVSNYVYKACVSHIALFTSGDNILNPVIDLTKLPTLTAPLALFQRVVAVTFSLSFQPFTVPS